MSDHIILDCIGLACPEPVVRCLKTIKDTQTPKIMVLVDNAAAEENIRRALHNRGYACESVQEKRDAKDIWRITALYVANSATDNTDARADANTDARPETAPTGAYKTLVFITTETLGRGSDELGGKLMENFLRTLPEIGENLWRVVLLNGGVKLAATAGICLEALQKLEASGVDVLVCGACLNHYALLDKKAVGQTSNMLDVVTSLEHADKVIRP